MGLDEQDFVFFNKMSTAGQNIHWFCKECNLPTIEMLKIIKEIKSKSDRFEKNLMTMKNEVSLLSKKIDEGLGHLSARLDNYQAELKASENRMKLIEDKVNDKINETSVKLAESVDQQFQNKIAVFDGKWAEVVKATQQVEGKIQNVTTNISGVQETLGEVKKHAAEEKDKESRVCNIIIYNVPESDNEDKEARPVEDKNFCLDVFNNILDLTIASGDIKKIFRLGKRNTGDKIKRPLLLQFRDRVLKNMIMESLSKLRNAEEEHRNLIFAHDMTPGEREECRKLVAEAKKREHDDESGEYIYRVRGFPGKHYIVKIKKVIPQAQD
ncbi:MAG: hypothetical protein WAX04_00510 [Oscillospiraceae bacterium]